MINPILIILYFLIFLFIIIYLNKDKFKTIFLTFKKAGKEKYVKICPKCGSIDVRTDFSNPIVWAYGTTTKYKCNSCSYLGTLFPEVLENNIQIYKKSLNEKKKEGKIAYKNTELIDTSTGYYVGIFEVILGLLGFLAIPVIFFINKELEHEDILLLMSTLIYTLIISYLVLRIYKRRKNDSNLR